MTLMKAILGLCLGLALMAALQTAGVWSLQEHIKSQSNTGYRSAIRRSSATSMPIR
jgi:hypothetical protein